MIPTTRLLSLVLFWVLGAGLCVAQDPAPKLLFDPAAPDAAGALQVNGVKEDTTVAIEGAGIDVTVIPSGKGSFPGVMIMPAKPYDASGFGHIEATVTNHGTKPIRLNLRLDNEGPWQSDPWNATVVSIKPGETKVVATIFGYSYGRRAYALKPEAITKVILFAGKSDVEQKFRIEKIQAAGPVGEKPYVDPNTVAVKPDAGVLLSDTVAIQPKQVVGRAGAKAVVAESGKSFTIDFPGKSAQESVLFRPPQGMWNLSQHLQVRVKVKNTGSQPITPAVKLESRGGAGDVIPAANPIPAGAEGEIVASFIPARPWQGADLPEMHEQQGPAKGFKDSVPGTGSLYASNTTTGLAITAAGAGSIQVLSVIADMPPQRPLPEWLGKKPPVDGEWAQTLNENFDGDAINNQLWNNYTEGEWHLGKETAYSKDNVIVKDGKLHLRVEKRRTHHNDNPAYPVHNYATGHADTYGKWVQRYGYFEARLKLPTAPNAFTAFWMMPDRGLEYAAEKKTAYGESRNFQRNSTNGFGMEFDIMEQLSIWGPNRHDFGMHWDHYMQHHKSIGTFSCYFQPDAEGFLTVGMFWEPGRVVMYQQGREAARWETKRISSLPSYLILQHITGGWETEGMDDSTLPSDLVFDYVRVWQRKDLASDMDGPKPNDGGRLPPTVK